MQVREGRYCLEAQEMLLLMGMNCLQQLCKRNQALRVQRACNGRPALYAVEALPYEYKVEVYKRFPACEPKEESSPLMDEVKAIPEALAFYQAYTFENGQHLPLDKAQEYANNAAILVRCGEVIREVVEARGRTGKHVQKKQLWQKMADSIERLQEAGMTCSLPQSGDRLRKKYAEYLEQGYASLINGRFGNQHAAKVSTTEQENLLITLCGDGRNLTNEMVASLYNQVAQVKGWQTLTAGAVACARQKNSLITDAGQHGKRFMLNNRLMQVKRSKPTQPMLMWSADGWDVELFFQQKMPNGRTRFDNRLTVVVILDAMCNYPMGYAIGSHENPDVIKRALASAVRHSKELYGEMLMVDEFQSDHYAIKTLMPYYEMIADKVIPAQVGNAKSKPVERYFETINDTYCHTKLNWSGYGITSRKEKQPNVEALNQRRHEFPDMAGCIAQIEDIIAMERMKKRDQMLAIRPERRKMDEELFLLNFGETTGKRNAIEGCGIRIMIEGQKRQYDCFEPSFRVHNDVRWEIRYDRNDLSRVLAVNEDGSLRYMLEEKYVQPMALGDRRAGDAEQLQRVRDYNTKLIQEVVQRKSEADQCTYDLINGAGIDLKLSQMIICDSRGQHKDVRNERRAIQAETIEALPAAPQQEPEEDDLYELL